jgi:hypothetical protein
LFAQGDTNVSTLVNTLSGTKAKVGPDASVAADQDIDGATDAQNNGYAFTDVQVIDGVGFEGKLKLNAILTENVVGKYLNVKDQVKGFDYDLGGNGDVFDLAISAANLEAAGAVTRGDFVLKINGNGGNDTISTAIYSGKVTQYSPGELANGTAAWYTNASLHADLSIHAGAGDDVVNTFGSGDWTVDLGAGNDTYYADNAGLDALGRKATWVYNAADPAYDALVSDTIDSYAYVHNVSLQVSFKDKGANEQGDASGTFKSVVVAIPELSTGLYGFSDQEINQAIMAAINNNEVLNKLLVATDGPSGVLVVTAKSDGEHVAGDLELTFTGPTLTDSQLTELKKAVIAKGNAEMVKFADAIGISPTDPDHPTKEEINGIALTGTNSWQTYVDAQVTALNDLTTSGAYEPTFAEDGGSGISGQNSSHVSDNVIDAGAGNDVIVLSTGLLSNDTIVWKGIGNGNDTIVNFVQDSSGAPGTEAVFTVTLGGSVSGTVAASDSYALTIDGKEISVTAVGTETSVDNIAALFEDEEVVLGGLTFEVTDVTGKVLTFTAQATGAYSKTPGVTFANKGTSNGLSIADGTGTVVLTTPGVSDGSGVDALDFRAYGVAAVYLDNDARWEADRETEDTPTLTVAGAVSKEGIDDEDLGGNGKTYIVLKKLYADDTIYEITWRKDQAAGKAGAGEAAINGDEADAPAEGNGIIGTVNFGQELDAGWFIIDNVLL